MTTMGSGDEERSWAADKRDFVAEWRDGVADGRDMSADDRERPADAREAALDEWAKGILMERLRITPEDAFDVLRRSSQHLNVKLREVARRLSETGEIPEGAA
jgi:hypothetical protein